MALNRQRLITAILVMVFCALTLAGAQAEIKPVASEENGRIRKIVWTDDAGNPCPGPEGYATVQYSYKKDSTTEMYFDAEGNPFETDGGFYGRTVTLDGKKRVTQVEYLGANGARTETKQGYAMVATVYYGFGEIRSVTFYGLNKKPVTVPSLGYASVSMEYSGTTMTARIYRNAKKKPVDSTEGYAAVRQKLDKQHQVIRIKYEHADGSNATGPDGWFRCIKDRDEKGRIVSIKYYDENDELTDRGADYAWEGREYEGENLVKVTRYDVNGEKVADRAGVTTVVRQMKDDRIIRESFRDKDGNAVTNDLGAGAVVYGYDHMGRIETVSYLGLDGTPANCLKGYAGYRDQRDDDGATVSRTFLGTDGLPVETAGGYAEIRYICDDTKTLTATKYYNANGAQVQAN